MCSFFCRKKVTTCPCRLVGPFFTNFTLAISKHNDLVAVQDKSKYIVAWTRIANSQNTLFLNSYNHSEAFSITEN